MSKIVSLSEAVSIALHGMVLIARSGKVVNVVEIADRTKTSKHHVAKIFQRLVKEGFLHSSRGPNGGFTLKKKAHKITLLEIYEAIEGKIEISDCLADHPVCPFDKCIMGNIAKRLSTEFRDYLRNQTLQMYLPEPVR